MKRIFTFGITLALIPASFCNAQAVGVAECDSFLKKYETCTTSLSEPSQKQTKELLQQSIIDMRKQFLDLKQSVTQDQL
jgi:hypothetical protein